MTAQLVPDHIAAMTAACGCLPRRLANEGLRDSLAIGPEATTIDPVGVRDLTPEIAVRFRHCRHGTGLDIRATAKP
ncbi:hypothetical protein [Methylobacterium planeticum]|uniref:Uncharacterized protein n=1 Tax=Methylobacterium planeticum TaxID=2615211 RepID=A0A6N6MSJ5_9HYPH|nr:hypothetical protein [Methylobacterium planeticum]KAB1072397.1 hypothetical protein F6X51_15490 [Methylobacterium planeticum]